MRQEKRSSGRIASGYTEVRPTPIWISKRTRTLLLLGSLVALVLLTWLSPSLPVMLLGGFALALVVSFPVRALSRFMLLTIINGSEIAGLLGAIFTVPTVAVAKELFDFFRVHLRTRS